MTNHASYYLFVYGSLRSGFQSSAYDYISRYFKFFGHARVRGKLYDAGDYPAGVPTSDEHFIRGELYLVRNEKEFSWIMGQLDDYEGVVAESNEQPLYRREIADVHINDAIVPAWVYWYNGEVTGKPQIVSGDVMDFLNSKKTGGQDSS